MLKRSIDVLVAGILFLAAFPLLLVCGLLVKFDSPGPVLFRQWRMGRGFRPFRIVKLRTMKAGEGGAPITLALDVRITPVGRWLRRWKLDELPQLWNVLRGEMSLVGPRPVIPELAWEFAADYRVLLRVRPGLTDPATVQYCHEAAMLARADDPMDYFKHVAVPDKLRISTGYLERATVWRDCGVIVRTIGALLSPPPRDWSKSPQRHSDTRLILERDMDEDIAEELVHVVRS